MTVDETMHFSKTTSNKHITKREKCLLQSINALKNSSLYKEHINIARKRKSNNHDRFPRFYPLLQRPKHNVSVCPLSFNHFHFLPNHYPLTKAKVSEEDANPFTLEHDLCFAILHSTAQVIGIRGIRRIAKARVVAVFAGRLAVLEAVGTVDLVLSQ